MGPCFQSGENVDLVAYGPFNGIDTCRSMDNMPGYKITEEGGVNMLTNKNR